MFGWLDLQPVAQVSGFADECVSSHSSRCLGRWKASLGGAERFDHRKRIRQLAQPAFRLCQGDHRAGPAFLRADATPLDLLVEQEPADAGPPEEVFHTQRSAEGEIDRGLGRCRWGRGRGRRKSLHGSSFGTVGRWVMTDEPSFGHGLP